MASPPKDKLPKQLPPPNSDFYELVETLPADDLAVVKQVRAFMETKVAPIINKYWIEDSFLSHQNRAPGIPPPSLRQ